MTDEPALAEGAGGLTRRRLLTTAGTLAGAAWTLPRLPLEMPARADPPLVDTSAFSMAMHIHASFSELNGSMHGHLDQAQRNAVDVIWWTDHDYRMSAFNFRREVHFDKLSGELENGRAWNWLAERSRLLSADSGGSIVSSPASPLDPSSPGALRVVARSTTTGWATLRYLADASPSDDNYQANATNQVWRIEVFPELLGWDAYLEIKVRTSWHPPVGGRPGGTYELSYRFGGRGAANSRVAQGLLGVITIPVKSGQWNSVTLSPATDIAALWPDLDYRDFSTSQLRLGAASRNGRTASGAFDYLRFSRDTSGQVPLTLQQDIVSSYALQFPGVTQRQGLEVSGVKQHINWYGGAVTLPDYQGIPWSDTSILMLVDMIHANGGVASYNHPFGMASGAPFSSVAQDRIRARVAAAMLQKRAYGMDLLEVGYRTRGRIDLQHHLALWDVCSRNALFLTGNGTTDDHTGTDWVRRLNNFLTYAWAPSTSEADLVSAMLSGRLYAGAISGFRGALDLLVDGICPMGSVSVSDLPNRALRVIATGVPPDGSLRVAQGAVDYAGPAVPADNIQTVAVYPASVLSTGFVDLLVDTAASSFLRTEVLDAAGAVVGLSNPVWLLREPPPYGIPAARAC